MCSISEINQTAGIASISIPLKVYGPEKQIRRFEIEVSQETGCYDSFAKEISEVFGIPKQRLILKYVDNEGDEIVFSSDKELNTFLKIVEGNNPVRIYVEKKGAIVKPVSVPQKEKIAVVQNRDEIQRKNVVEDNEIINLKFAKGYLKTEENGKLSFVDSNEEDACKFVVQKVIKPEGEFYRFCSYVNSSGSHNLRIGPNGTVSVNGGNGPWAIFSIDSSSVNNELNVLKSFGHVAKSQSCRFISINEDGGVVSSLENDQSCCCQFIPIKENPSSSSAFDEFIGKTIAIEGLGVNEKGAIVFTEVEESEASFVVQKKGQNFIFNCTSTKKSLAVGPRGVARALGATGKFAQFVVDTMTARNNNFISLLNVAAADKENSSGLKGCYISVANGELKTDSDKQWLSFRVFES